MTSQIFIFDDLHPEDNAMLQALYSRSPNSVVNHVEKVKESGSGKFMERYYVGYGHASIGDCGSTTIYIENVSIMAAKAIQDHPLYSGQEASTRYLDFSVQPQIDPYNKPESGRILKQWLALYNGYMPKVKAALAERHPFNTSDYKSEKMWDSAIAARAFDTLRCLLPVGTGTLLSWHTNLRQARDHLRRLAHHPLEEVRNIAHKVYAQLLEKYPNSFHADDLNPESLRHGARNAFVDDDAMADSFLTTESAHLSAADMDKLRQGRRVWDAKLLDIEGARAQDGAVMAARPQGAPLSRRLMKHGVYRLSFLLDYGSFRDLQRHRNGLCQLPLVSGEFGFYSWYLDEIKALLSESDYAGLVSSINAQLAAIKALGGDPLRDQYLYPLGMACLCQVTYSIPQMVYVAELRSGKTVHPSLRPIAQAIGVILSETLPELKIYVDYDGDSFSAKRGQQDIVEKQAMSA